MEKSEAERKKEGKVENMKAIFYLNACTQIHTLVMHSYFYVIRFLYTHILPLIYLCGYVKVSQCLHYFF